jgi:MurNAc alpha-1-phosphate uridylyltransferase
MKAMILAAGVGERMRPLTDHTPKPLLPVAGVPLIEHQIRRLAQVGFDQLVINVSHLAQQIIDYCGDGSRWHVSIAYSREEEPLETAGGIHRALPLLGRDPFLVVNGDIWCDYDFGQLFNYRPASGESAHLVMVSNRAQHPQGDFTLAEDGWIQALAPGASGLTYAGIGVYTPAFFGSMAAGKLAMRPLLDQAIVDGRLTGEYHPGNWQDVGTPERLQALNQAAR